LIDGHSILNRAFYGLPDLTNSEGLHTNAVYGFLTILFKMLEEEEPQLNIRWDEQLQEIQAQFMENTSARESLWQSNSGSRSRSSKKY